MRRPITSQLKQAIENDFQANILLQGVGHFLTTHRGEYTSSICDHLRRAIISAQDLFDHAQALYEEDEKLRPANPAPGDEEEATAERIASEYAQHCTEEVQLILGSMLSIDTLGRIKAVLEIKFKECAVNTWVPANANPLDELSKMAASKGGSLTLHNEGGHKFATMSLPLRPDHWLYQKSDPVLGVNCPPMPLRTGTDSTIKIESTMFEEGYRVYTRVQFQNLIREAGMYAYRCASMNGKEEDMDPDAFLQNLIVGFLGYHTENGLCGDDDWANPPHLRKVAAVEEPTPCPSIHPTDVLSCKLSQGHPGLHQNAGYKWNDAGRIF